MKEYEYIKIHLSKLTEEIIEKYDLNEKAYKEGRVYIDISRVIYGLKQSGLIASKSS